MTQSGTAVQLYLYDLSQGMAKQISVALTGRYFEAIWHSSVVVYGREYYFGQGIMTAAAGTTMHGQPVEIVNVGETYLPQDVVEDYVDGMRQEFSATKYHLLKFNCNTFSDELIKALTGGSGVPDKVRNLPDDFLETEMGRMLLPMIENTFGQSARSMSTAPTAPAPAPAVPAAAALGAVDFAKIQGVKSYSELQQRLHQHRAVVVYFTSFTCPPCRVIAPEYERLIQELNSADAIASGRTVYAVKVDCSMQGDVAAPFNVRGTPTFMFFLNGQLTEQFAGADSARLRSELDLLIYSAYPPHRHTQLRLAGLEAVGRNYILFKQTGNLDPVFRRISEAVENTGSVDEMKKLMAGILADPSLDTEVLIQQLRKLYEALPLESAFPVVDLVRMLAAVTPFTTSSAGGELAARILADTAAAYATSNNSAGQPPKALALLALRLACNLFASPQSVELAVGSGNSGACRRTTDLLVAALLAEEPSVRRTAASLAFNLAAHVSRQAGQVDDGEDWLIELVSAIVKGVEDETASAGSNAKESVPVVSRLLAALALVLFQAPESILDLARLLNAQQVARSANTTNDALVAKVVADIESLLAN